MNKELRELPKKMTIEQYENGEFEGSNDFMTGRNQCLDLVKPIHQKQVLRIKELEIALDSECEDKECQLNRANHAEDELTRLKQKEELDVGKVAEILFEIDNPNPALLTNRFCGHNLWVHSEDTQNKYKKLATAIVSRFSLVNKELIDKALNRLGSPTMQYNKEIENEERAKIIQDVYEILSKAEKEKP